MKKRLFEVEMWMWNPTVVTLRVEADGWESACDAAYTRLRDTREVFEEGAEYGERLDDLECWELTGARKIDADGVYKGTFEPYDRARGMLALEFKRPNLCDAAYNTMMDEFHLNPEAERMGEDDES